MDNLVKYYNERVVITDSNGKIWHGYVDDYEYPDESDSGEEEIGIHCSDDGEHEYIGFMKSEIESIRIE